MGQPREEAVERSCDLLGKALGPEFIADRQGPGGARLQYLKGGSAVQLANFIFGHDGWSSECRDRSHEVRREGEEWIVDAVCTTRVTWWKPHQTVWHDGTGTGSKTSKRCKGEALDVAVKEAETDSLKRALKLFGEALGNCLYHQEYLSYIKVMRAKTPKGAKPEWNVDDLLRRAKDCEARSVSSRSFVSATSGGGTSKSDLGAWSAGEEVELHDDDFIDDDGLFVAPG